MGEGEGEGEGEVTKNWYEGLGAEWENHDYVTGADSLESFVKQAVHAQTMIGKKGIVPPDSNASLEDYADFYEQLGRPRNVSTYAFDDVEFPEGIPRQENFEKEMLQEVYDAGLSEAQAKRLFSKYANVFRNEVETMTKSAEQNQAQLEADLRATFGSSLGIKLENATRAWESLIGDQAEAETLLGSKMADGTELRSNPAIIRAMAELGSRLGEDGVIGHRRPTYTKTPAEARADIDAFRADPLLMKQLQDKHDPGHDTALAKWLSLQELANAGS
jgi:hypothetical protein